MIGPKRRRVAPSKSGPDAVPPGSEDSSSRFAHFWELVDYFSRVAPMSDDPDLDPGLALETLQAWLNCHASTSATARLPLLTFEAAGGSGVAILPVAVAWQVTRQAVKLFDDVEDGDVVQGLGEAVNTASALLFVAQSALEHLPSMLGPTGATGIRRALSRAMLRASAGQREDLVAAADVWRVDPDGWLRIASGKSGELLGWAASAGAMVATGDEIVATNYHTFGFHLGILLQVADDFNGIWNPSGRSDLRAGCLSLPVCYALHVAQAHNRESFLALLAGARRGDSQAEARARQALGNLGAQAYCLAVARIHYHAAMAALDRARATDQGRQVLKEALNAVLPALTELEGSETKCD